MEQQGAADGLVILNGTRVPVESRLVQCGPAKIWSIYGQTGCAEIDPSIDFNINSLSDVFHVIAAGGYSTLQLRNLTRAAELDKQHYMSNPSNEINGDTTQLQAKRH